MLKRIKPLIKISSYFMQITLFFLIVGLYRYNISKMKIGFHLYDVPQQGVEVYLLYAHAVAYVQYLLIIVG